MMFAGYYKVIAASCGPECIEIQKTNYLVAEIEAEQALVATNRELITRFEKKIQATLARVWGEELEH